MAGEISKRALKEIAKLSKNPDVHYLEDDNHHYMMFTPQDGFYKGQKHIVELKFTYGTGKNVYKYPKSPPNPTFITPVFHANVYTSGSICLDTISQNWSPMFGLEYLAAALSALLNDPNPSSPANGIAGRAYSMAVKKDTLDEFQQQVTDHYIKNCKSNKLVKDLLIKFDEVIVEKMKLLGKELGSGSNSDQ